MNKQETLELLNKEKEYYRVEYLEQYYKNKKIISDRILQRFSNYWEKQGYLIALNELKLSAKTIDEAYFIRVMPDSDKKTIKPLWFELDIERAGNENHNYLIRISKNSYIDEPNFSRLLENPYKGKELIDIEIEEEQKNIDYFKKYIADLKIEMDFSYLCMEKESKKEIGIFNTINDLVNKLKMKVSKEKI